MPSETRKIFGPHLYAMDMRKRNAKAKKETEMSKIEWIKFFVARVSKDARIVEVTTRLEPAEYGCSTVNLTVNFFDDNYGECLSNANRGDLVRILEQAKNLRALKERYDGDKIARDCKEQFLGLISNAVVQFEFAIGDDVKIVEIVHEHADAK